MPNATVPSIRISLFSGISVRIDQTEVTLRSPQRSGLLALLALRPEGSWARSELVECLWPGEDPDLTFPRLRTALSALRNDDLKRPSAVETSGDRVAISRDAVVDVSLFRRTLKDAARSNDPEEKLRLHKRAVELYKGELLPGFYVEQIVREREALHGQCLTALRSIIDFHLSASPKDAIPFAERAVELDPLADQAHTDLITVYARAGYADSARRQYRIYEQILFQDIGEAPSPELLALIKELPQAIPNRKVKNGNGSNGRPERLSSIGTPNVEQEDQTIEPSSRRELLLTSGPSEKGQGLARRWRKRLATAAVVLIGASAIGYRSFSRQEPDPDQQIERLVALRHSGPQADSPEQQKAKERERAGICVTLGDEAWGAWYGKDEIRWVERIKSVNRDIDQGLMWLRDHDPQGGLRLSSDLVRYWVIRSDYSIARRWMESNARFIPDADLGLKPRAKLALAGAILVSTQVHRPESKIPLQRSLALATDARELYSACGDTIGVAHSVRISGHILHALDQNPAAVIKLRAALQQFKSLGNEAGEAYTLWGLSLCIEGKNTVEAATKQGWCALESLRMWRKVQNDRGIAQSWAAVQHIVKELSAEKDRAIVGDTADLLHQIEPECNAQLELALAHNLQAESRDIRRTIAEIAISLGEPEIGIAQLGYLAEPKWSIERQVRLSAAFVELSRSLPNPPSIREDAKDFVERAQRLQNAGPNTQQYADQGRRMTWQEALIEAIH